MQIVNESHAGIAAAARTLREGRVVAYPTETVYGLGVDPFSDDALRLLFEIKKRDAGKPVLVIVSCPEQLKKITASIPDKARECMEQFWPGPLSLLFPAAAGLPDLLTAGSGKICARCPSCETARHLCAAFGGPITSSSANPSGEQPALSIEEMDLDGISVAIDGGQLQPSAPSTIYDPETGKVFREGVIPTNELPGFIG